MNFLVSLFGMRLCREILLIRSISWIWLSVFFGLVFIGMLLVIMVILFFILVLKVGFCNGIGLCGVRNVFELFWYIRGLF